jgi:hypothetical protein
VNAQASGLVPIELVIILLVLGGMAALVVGLFVWLAPR